MRPRERQSRQARQSRLWFLLAIVLALALLAVSGCAAPSVPQNEPTTVPTAVPTAALPTATIAPATPAVVPATPTVEQKAALPSPSPTARPAPTAAPTQAPTPQVASGRGSLIYSTRSGDKVTQWIVPVEGGKPVQLGSATVASDGPPMGYTPYSVLSSSDGRVVLLQRTEPIANQLTPVPGQQPFDSVLYALSPDGKSRREVARGTQVMLRAFSGEDGPVSGTVVDKSLTPDGKQLWFMVAKYGSGPSEDSSYVWYTWNFETGERKEVLTTRLYAEDALYLADTSADYSKALLVKGNLLPTMGPPKADAKLVVLLRDLATGATRELVTVDQPGSTPERGGAMFMPDGKSALVLGRKTLLVDLASGKSTDLNFANSRQARLTPDGKHLLLYSMLVQKDTMKSQVAIVDLAKTTVKTIDKPEFEMLYGTEGFIPGTSLITLRGNEGKESSLYLLDAASGTVEKLAFGFLPTARYLPASGRLAVYYSLPENKDGSSSVKLTLLDPKAPKSRAELTLAGNLGSMVESPDGKSLLVATSNYYGGSNGGSTGRGKILKIDLANPKPVELVSAAEITDLQPSPDGASLAYTQRDKVGGTPSVYTMSFDGSKPQKVVADGGLWTWVSAEVGRVVTLLAAS